MPKDSYRRVLANRSFLVLWFSQGLASLGQSILYVAAALYVYDLTGAAEDVSLVGTLELRPWMVSRKSIGRFERGAQYNLSIYCPRFLDGSLYQRSAGSYVSGPHCGTER